MTIIKQTTLAGILSVLTIFATSVHAEGSYLGFGAGLMFNLGQLGGTITNDGLKSTDPKASMSGAGLGSGCGLKTDATAAAACRAESPGTEQDGIIPNRTLKDYANNVPLGLLESEVGGSMTGLVLNIFYEMPVSSWGFFRVDFSYNKRMMGGESSSSIVGVEWYRDKWDYKAMVIPMYFGVKANIGETSAVYAGAGVNYHRGGWSVEVTNLGDIPTSLLGSAIGAHTATVVNKSGRTEFVGGPILNGSANFVTEGFGFNVVMGVEGKLASGNKVFFEIDTLLAGDTESTQVQDVGAINHLALNASKPIVLAGTTYRFGYKLAL